MGFFYNVAILAAIILTTGTVTIGGFIIGVQNNLRRKISKDAFLGDTAERISQQYKAISSRNKILLRIHQSCPAMLATPAPAGPAALKAAKIYASSLRLEQESAYVVSKVATSSALANGYKIHEAYNQTRRQNLCQIAGPLQDFESTRLSIRDHEAGVIVETRPQIFWTFRHENSRSPWF